MASPSPPPPPPSGLTKPNLSPFYYGLVVIGSTALVLALYNLIIVAWCSQRRRRRSDQSVEFVSRSFETSSTHLVSSFKYRKETNEQNYENECAVCLSAFEDGEDVRQLPNCKHSFHAPCIDMWLFSHSDCPLCRATVEPLFVAQCLVRLEDENSRSSSTRIS
ncbi:hypothetical protein Sjap_011830 [Stephania japonica]|uniref:RING-type domain-containing protein n=1 Tax=Stephania japonica TaxID=461633 RepID=A0AAP0JE60_9MAGN